LELFGLQVFTHLSQLDRVDAKFRQSLSKVGIKPCVSLNIKKSGELLQLSIRCSVIKLREETVTLVTLQDIRGELERKELDSWVKLIKVLNHEIMNSLAPVTSIAQSLGTIWKERAGGGNKDVDVVRTIDGLGVIEERGEALMRFVQSYRMFTKMPELKLSQVSICALFDRLSILVSPLKDDINVTIRFIQPSPDFFVSMDEQLMAQVIINLVKNGVQAVKDVHNPLVEVACKQSNLQSAEITIRDNGCGIPDEITDEIFIPFFTTKTDGNGIGLSYSRQILRAHGGTIHFKSVPGKTVFFVQW
jgi:two-component system, NtrC family, nitrogen regulation sensor histidine kinase NtrY